MNQSFARVVAAWQRFWFDPQETSTLAIFRIAFGLVALGWTASLGPNLSAFYGPHGIVPRQLPDGPGAWGVLDIWHGSAAVVVLFAVTLAGAAALTLGLFSRFAAVLVWIGIVSFEHRNSLISNSGDGLVRNLAFFCMLSPSGESLSIDRLLKTRERFWEFPARAPWALRLIQLQISIGYLTAIWDKSGNVLWRAGTAVSYSLRIQDIHRFATPSFITHSVIVTELFTYGTLVTELSLAIFIWNKTLRPWILPMGVLLHLSIDFWVLVGFFSYAMFCGYIAFTPPETASRSILATRDRLRRIGARRAVAGPPGGAPVQPARHDYPASTPESIPGLTPQEWPQE
jgi:Vitamin K-dependent gamma-carboxylase